MGRNRDELAKRRKAAERPSASPAVDPQASATSNATAADTVTEHSSSPDVLDSQAAQRDERADARDVAGVRRDQIVLPDDDQVSLDRMLAARDRAAAALDREEAALDRRRAGEYLRRTYRDELTGALQRAAGRDQLSREVDRANRFGEPLVIAFIDVVKLKDVNDAQGHAAGDALLQAVGRAVREGLRSYDTVVRYGGDEFVCALPRAEIDDAIRRFGDVERLLIRLSEHAAIRIGLAELGEGESLDAVISRADRELYDGPTVLGSVHASVGQSSSARRSGKTEDAG
jgi:diguanylate cyclase (GGDEF)-like protein